jgi:hypothetical protein
MGGFNNLLFCICIGFIWVRKKTTIVLIVAFLNGIGAVLSLPDELKYCLSLL